MTAARRFLATYVEPSGRWQVSTDRGDQMSARLCIMATGCLSAPRIPDIPGRELFAGETVEQMLQHYATLLANIVAQPDEAISKLSLMTAAEEHQVVEIGPAADDSHLLRRIDGRE